MQLVGAYCIDEHCHLLSVCGLANTHSAAGRMLLMNLTNYNEFERAMIVSIWQSYIYQLSAGLLLTGRAHLASNANG